MYNLNDKKDGSQIPLKEILRLLAVILFLCIASGFFGGIIAALTGSAVLAGAGIGLAAGIILILMLLICMTGGGAG